MHSSVAFLTSTLNIIRTRFINSTHFEYVEMFKFTHNFLMYIILIAND